MGRQRLTAAAHKSGRSGCPMVFEFLDLLIIALMINGQAGVRHTAHLLGAKILLYSDW